MERESGFVLVVVLFMLLLLSGLGILLHQQVSRSLVISESVGGQLRAANLAQNGIEAAETALASRTLDSLLAGADGEADCLPGHPGVNPLEFASAATLDWTGWSPACDDGLLVIPSAAESPGLALVRFSNNPEDPGVSDRDGLMLARSMGLVPSRSPLKLAVRNHVCLVETLFRIEKHFRFRAPLILLGPGGTFQWARGVEVDGGDGEAGLFLLEYPEDGGLARRVTETLAAASVELLGGIRKAGSSLLAELTWFERLETAGYWKQLAAYAEGESLRAVEAFTGDCLWLPSGGVLPDFFSGLAVTRGEVRVERGACFRGLLIHLGSGRLTLESGARIEGALWMAYPREEGDRVRFLPISLKVGENVIIRFDETALLPGRSRLPVTRLATRYIHPEMGR